MSTYDQSFREEACHLNLHMKGKVYIGDDWIGDADFRILDDSMGVIGGELEISGLYQQYQVRIQEHCKEKGISNSHDLSYRLLLHEMEVQAEGGMGIMDFPEYGEITVEAGGLDPDAMEMIRQETAR